MEVWNPRFPPQITSSLCALLPPSQKKPQSYNSNFVLKNAIQQAWCHLLHTFLPSRIFLHRSINYIQGHFGNFASCLGIHAWSYNYVFLGQREYWLAVITISPTLMFKHRWDTGGRTQHYAWHEARADVWSYHQVCCPLSRQGRTKSVLGTRDRDGDATIFAWQGWECSSDIQQVQPWCHP